MGPRNFIDHDHSLIAEDKPVNSLCDSAARHSWYFLSAYVVKITKACVRVLAAGYRPDAMTRFNKNFDIFHELIPVTFYVHHLSFRAILQCSSWLSWSKAGDVHGVGNSNWVILGVEEHDFAFEKFITVLDKNTSPFFTFVFLIAGLYGKFLIDISHFEEIFTYKVPDIDISARKRNVGEDAWISNRIKIFRTIQ